jgi:hypothetical protein
VRERDLLILLLVWSFLVYLLFGLLTGPPNPWSPCRSVISCWQVCSGFLAMPPGRYCYCISAIQNPRWR